MVDPLVAAPAAAYAGIGVVGALAAASAGMAAGRLAGALAEGELRPWPTGGFLVVEAALAGSLAAALRR